MFSGGIEMGCGMKWVKNPTCFKELTFPDLQVFK